MESWCQVKGGNNLFNDDKFIRVIYDDVLLVKTGKSAIGYVQDVLYELLYECVKENLWLSEVNNK